MIRPFILYRTEDESGVSGTGQVAEGVVFSDGTAVLRWTASFVSTAVYADLDTLIAIHGHDGKTVARFVDQISMAELQAAFGKKRQEYIDMGLIKA